MAYSAAQDETTAERARLYAEKGVTQEEVRQSGATEREMHENAWGLLYTPGAPDSSGARLTIRAQTSRLSQRRLWQASGWVTRAPMVARPPCGRKRLLSPRPG